MSRIGRRIVISACRHKWQRTLFAVLVGALLALTVYGNWALAQVDDDDEIVYLDPDGVIRMVDPDPPSEALAVNWFSPSGGWVDFTLADVTNDGDAEIIAVRPEADGGRLIIYDPVAIGANDDEVQFLDGVPWAVIYERVLSSNPRLVTTGEFDATRTGPEIVYDEFLPPENRVIPDDTRRFVILRQPAGETRGENWETQTTSSTGNDWTWIDTGNFDASGNDEVVLVDEERGNLSIYQVGDGFSRIYRNSNQDNEWRVARFGQFTAGGAEELGAVRTADFPLASAWVFRWQNSAVVDQFAERLIPSPRYMFWADIAGNGDDEMVMLRDVPQELGVRARLFIRDNSNDTIVLNDVQLDVDNGYQVGGGGDTDGDTRDEIAIMRGNRIRLYTEPERSTANVEFERSTDSRHILLGNLDAAGLAREPVLGTTRSLVTATLGAGQTAPPINVTVSDVTQGTSIPFTVQLENADEWAAVDASGTSTPATLSITLDAVGLQPGTYQGALILRPSAGSSAANPVTVDLRLEVESGVSTIPESIVVDYSPCEEPLNIRSVPVSVQGPTGVAYTTSLDGSPSWVSVVPANGTLPEIITLAVNPANRPNAIATANLVLSVDLPNAPSTRVEREILLICTNNRQFLPFLAAQ